MSSRIVHWPRMLNGQWHCRCGFPAGGAEMMFKHIKDWTPQWDRINFRGRQKQQRFSGALRGGSTGVVPGHHMHVQTSELDPTYLLIVCACGSRMIWKNKLSGINGSRGRIAAAHRILVLKEMLGLE